MMLLKGSYKIEKKHIINQIKLFMKDILKYRFFLRIGFTGSNLDSPIRFGGGPLAIVLQKSCCNQQS